MEPKYTRTKPAREPEKMIAVDALLKNTDQLEEADVVGQNVDLYHTDNFPVVVDATPVEFVDQNDALLSVPNVNFVDEGVVDFTKYVAKGTATIAASVIYSVVIIVAGVVKIVAIGVFTFVVELFRVGSDMTTRKPPKVFDDTPSFSRRTGNGEVNVNNQIFADNGSTVNNNINIFK